MPERVWRAIGMDRMDRYAVIMVVDTVLRVVFAAVVALLVADPGSPAFAWTLLAAIACAHVPQLYLLATRRTRIGRLHDARGQVNGQAADVVVDELDLAGMDPRPQCDSQPLRGRRQVDCASHGPGRSVEGRDQPVARRVHQPAAVVPE